MIKTATIFRHCRPDPSGTISQVLRQREVKITECGPPFEPLAGFDPLGPDLLVVMGGSCGVYQMEHYPFLQDEMRIIQTRLDAGRPTLGVCLGAQLMAAALGARVYKGEQGSETGWLSVRVTEAGKNSPARHFDESLTKIMQWHGDTFTAPDGAVMLAGSARYPHQIFSAGPNAIGIQFHPEVTDEILSEWFIDAAYDVYSGKIDLPRMRQDTAEHLPGLQRQTGLFLNEWLDQISGAV